MILIRISTVGFTNLLLLVSISAWCQDDTRYKILHHEAVLTVTDGGLTIEDRMDLAFEQAAEGQESVVFYINPNIKDLRVRQEDQDLVFETKKEKLIMPLQTRRSTSIHLSYFLPYSPSRNYYLDSTQLYLLNEYLYLPLPSLFTNEDPVTFDISVNSSNVLYPAKGVSRFKHISRRRPNIVAGNFKTVRRISNGKSYLYYFPEDLKIDSIKFIGVHNSVVSSDSLFERQLTRVSDSLHVFFLRRPGGHSLSAAHLILDQAYIESGNVSSPPGVIAHEVAHCWWGNTVGSENSALMESLAEYYASVYLTYCGDTAAFRDFYVSKSVDIEIDHQWLTPVEDVRQEDGHRYRTIAYKVIPKLYYQLEQSVGMDYMLSRMKDLFFAGREGDCEISFSDLYAALNNGSAAWEEFCSYMKAKHQFPNYFVHVNPGNEFLLFSTQPVYKKDIPVEVRFTNGRTIADTVLLEPGRLTARKYADSVLDVIVDPDFTLIQSRISDDTWLKPEYRIFPKLGEKYDKRYYDFARKYTSYLFSIGDPVELDDITNDDSVRKHLTKASEAVTKNGIKLVGYELFLQHPGAVSADFRIFILYKYQGKTGRGFTNGLINADDQGIKLVRLDRLSL